MTQQRRHFFLDVDDDVSLPQIFAEARILTLQLLHFFRHGIALGLGPALLRSQGLPDPMGSISPPIGQQRGVQTFATEKGADAAGCGGSRLRFLQDAQFVFRGVATPLRSSSTLVYLRADAAQKAQSTIAGMSFGVTAGAHSR